MSGRTMLAGAAWSGLNTVVGVLVPLLFFVGFARLAPVDQVGIVGFALAALEVLKALTPQGLYEASMAEAELHPDFMGGFLSLLIASAAVVMLVYGAGLVLAAGQRADVAALFWPLALLSLKAGADIVAQQPQALLARRRDIARLGMRSLLTNLAGAAAGILVGAAAGAVWGIVAYYVAQALAGLLALAWGSGALARPARHLHAGRALWREGVLASLVRLVAAVNNYADQLLVAAFVPLADLARYNLGKRIELTQVTAGQTFGNILFQPLFARATDALGLSFRRALVMMSVLGSLATAAVAVNSRELVLVVFGEKWIEAAPALAWLAVSGYARILGSVHGAYFSVSRLNRVLLSRSVASAVLGTAVIVIFGAWGVVWCAAGLAVKNAAVTGWSAVETRALAPWRFNLLYALLLPGCAVAGAWAGREAAQALLPGTTIGLTAGLLLSGFATLGAVSLFFGPRLVLVARGRRNEAAHFER